MFGGKRCHERTRDVSYVGQIPNIRLTCCHITSSKAEEEILDGKLQSSRASGNILLVSIPLTVFNPFIVISQRSTDHRIVNRMRRHGWQEGREIIVYAHRLFRSGKGRGDKRDCAESASAKGDQTL